MLHRTDAIGVFDSGVGGLTVLKELKKRLPAEDIIYLGDTARVPYGTKSKETVQLYSLQNTRFLQKKGVKTVIVACNSASSCALPLLRRSFPKLPITGVIVPGARAAARVTKKGRIGVIGTERTINSRAYMSEIKKAAPRAKVFAKACPLFVPIVEEGLTRGEFADLAVRHYLKRLKNMQIDTLILGCTHYPLLKNRIAAFMGKRVKLIDSAVETASVVVQILQQADLLRTKRGRTGKIRYYVTDTPATFRKLAGRFMGNISGPVHRASLE